MGVTTVECYEPSEKHSFDDKYTVSKALSSHGLPPPATFQKKLLLTTHYWGPEVAGWDLYISPFLDLIHHRTGR